MRIIIVALLVVCLIQGNQAGFGKFRKFWKNAAKTVRNTAQNVAQDVARTAQNVAKDVGRTAENVAKDVGRTAENVARDVGRTAENVAKDVARTADDIRDRVTNVAKDVISAAVKNVGELGEKIRKLNPDELLAIIENAEQEISKRVNSIQGLLDADLTDALGNAELGAKAAVQKATANWNSPVSGIVQKAANLGIDVAGCAVGSVLDLGKDTTSGAVSCVTKKILEGLELAKNLASLPLRTAKLVKESVEGWKTCDQRSGGSKEICRMMVLVPAAQESVSLVKDTVTHTTHAVKLVSTFKADLATCAGGLVVKQAITATAVGMEVVECVKGKMAQAA